MRLILGWVVGSGLLMFTATSEIGAQQTSIVPSVPLTLDEALREAHAANAQLPVAALNADIARTQVTEAVASRWPRLGLESGVNLGAPLAYTTSQGWLQLVGGDTLYSGGLRRANLRAAQYRARAAGFEFRIAEMDVDLNVRLRFAEFQREQDEVALRVQGIDRLQGYLSQVEARRAAGQPVGSDVLTTQVRLGTEQAGLADAQSALDDARLELNDLMGRDPRAPLALAPLPLPRPVPSAPTPWLAAPELRSAAASRGAAEAGIDATRAERRPQVSVAATVGALPVFGANAGTGPNGGTGVGASVLFSLTWSLWDAGVFRARLDRAQMVVQQARASEVAALRQTRLSWQLADAQQTRLYQQVQTWAANVPVARDAYLQTASMYNGGSATALEVLDAYAAWINASEAYADAVLRYREAEANALRWGTP